MSGWEAWARILISLGLGFLLVGLIMLFFSKLGISGFRLPGDIYIKRENFTFYFPVATCILISVVLSIIWHLISKK